MQRTWGWILVLGLLGGAAALGEPPPVDARRLPPRGLEAYGWTRLHWVVRTGDAEEVLAELDRGGAAQLEARDTLDRTPIHLAVLAVNPDVVRVLAEAGANVQARDRWGVTPLRRAVLLGEVRGWALDEVKAVLREHGAE